MTLLNDERTAKFQALSTVTHEMYHVTGFRAPYPRSYLEAYWEEETAGDICRFTETTRTFEEIAREFFLNFDSPVLAEVNKHLGYEHFPAPPYSLEQMMEKMAKNGVIQKIGDGSFRCSSFEEGRQSSLEKIEIPITEFICVNCRSKDDLRSQNFLPLM